MYDEIAMKFAEHHHGVVGTWELADAGLTEDQIRQLLGSRQWDRIGRSVIRRRGSPTSDDQEVAATLLDRGRGAKISGFTAGHLLGLDGCPLRPIQVIGTGATRGRRLPAGYRRVRTLPARWTTEVRGIGLIAPEMCAMQQFALSREETAERRVDVLWSLGRLSGRSIDLFLSDMGRSGRNGIAGLRRYRDARGLDYTPPATGMESRAIQVLRDAGIKVRRQVDVGCDEAWTGRVDLMVVACPSSWRCRATAITGPSSTGRPTLPVEGCWNSTGSSGSSCGRTTCGPDRGCCRRRCETGSAAPSSSSPRLCDAFPGLIPRKSITKRQRAGGAIRGGRS